MTTPITPSIVHTSIRHVRTEPLHNEFEYRSYSWLVDVDDLPELPKALRPLAKFDAGDHLGDPTRSIRANVKTFLATNGLEFAGGRILMLTNARVFGHVFNPLSVFWCLNDDGSQRCVVAEVHNTYGERHCYLLPVEAAVEPGGARVAKEFYVSPFNDVSGDYELRLPVPGEKLGLAIVLHRSAQPPFVASVTGTRRPITRRTLLRAFASVPWAPLRVIVQIRWQGIKLWARRLPIQPRPAHARQEGT